MVRVLKQGSEILLQQEIREVGKSGRKMALELVSLLKKKHYFFFCPFITENKYESGDTGCFYF